MALVIGCIAVALAAAWPGRPANAGGAAAYEQKSITLDAALSVAQTALGFGREHGRPTAVVIVDRAGSIVVALRDDMATDQFVQGAEQKAWTAANLRGSTQKLAKLVQSAEEDDAFLVDVPGALFLWGGIPLEVDRTIVGAIGTAGGTGADDQAQAERGVDAFQKLLAAGGG